MTVAKDKHGHEVTIGQKVLLCGEVQEIWPGERQCFVRVKIMDYQQVYVPSSYLICCGTEEAKQEAEKQ